MREELAVILHEDEKGVVTVQLHAATAHAETSFKNLHGKLSDPPSRVTLVSIDYKGNTSVTKAKDLPVEDPPKEDMPDGIVLGKGSIWLDKEKDDATESNG
jgi:hypothetical protein